MISAHKQDEKRLCVDKQLGHLVLLDVICACMLCLCLDNLPQPICQNVHNPTEHYYIPQCNELDSSLMIDPQVIIVTISISSSKANETILFSELQIYLPILFLFCYYKSAMVLIRSNNHNLAIM